MKRLFSASLLAAGLALASAAQAAQPLLNVSYDVMRDFYKDYNAAFQKHWEAEKGEKITIQMSHGGSSKQARAVIDGLPADVITMNQATDIDALADNGALVPKDWATRLPNNSAPFTSATVLNARALIGSFGSGPRLTASLVFGLIPSTGGRSIGLGMQSTTRSSSC